jgi:hypothetical protein
MASGAADEPPAGGPLAGSRLEGSIRLLVRASVSEPQACSVCPSDGELTRQTAIAVKRNLKQNVHQRKQATKRDSIV